MRKYICLLIFIMLITVVRVNSYKLPLKDKIIYLDIGHGGVDNGASYNELKEDELNLKIGYLLKNSLENKGAVVYMTRYDDYDLSNIDVNKRKKSDLYNRIKTINNSDADIYLSIHLNSTTSSRWNGIQLFYNNINSNNKLLAYNIKESLNNKRENKVINDYMYRNITKPGILIELGFISNSNDRNILLNDELLEDKITRITNGVVNYFVNKGVNV